MQARSVTWFAVIAVGCSSPSHSITVGQTCALGTQPSSPTEVVLSSSTACPGGTCLRVPPTPGKELPAGASYDPTSGLCSATCDDANDCNGAVDGACISGFTCGIVTTVGPTCCTKLCICLDYVIVPDGGEPATPAACDPANSANACCNLPGRDDDAAMYPLCSS